MKKILILFKKTVLHISSIKLKKIPIFLIKLQRAHLTLIFKKINKKNCILKLNFRLKNI